MRRRKLLTQALALSMTAAMLLTSVPVNAAEVSVVPDGQISVEASEDVPSKPQTDTQAATQEEPQTDVQTEAQTEAETVPDISVEEDVSADAEAEVQANAVAEEKAATEDVPATPEVTENIKSEQISEDKVVTYEKNPDGNYIDISDEEFNKLVEKQKREAVDPYSIDVKTASVDELNKVYTSNLMTDLAAWISSLSDEEIEVLRTADSFFAMKYYTTDEACKKDGLVAGEYKSVVDYLIKLSKCKHAEEAFPGTDGTAYINTSVGNSTIRVHLEGGVSPGSKKRRQVTISLASNVLAMDSKADHTSKGTDTDEYRYIWAHFGFTKPFGWVGAGCTKSVASVCDVYSLISESNGVLSLISGLPNNSQNIQAEGMGFYFVGNVIQSMMNQNGTVSLNFNKAGYNIVYDGTTQGYNYVDGGTVPAGSAKSGTITFHSGNGNGDSHKSITQPWSHWANPENTIGVPAGSHTNNAANLNLHSCYGAASTTCNGAPTANTYTVTFNPNGGIGNAPSVQGTQKFAGWRCDQNGWTGGAGAAISVSDGMSFTGQWTNPTVKLASAPTKSIKVSYNSNGGGSVSSQTGNLAFNGWKDSAGTTRSAGASMTLSGNANMTAQWGNATVKAANAPTAKSVTISYNTNGGSAVGATNGKETFKNWKGSDGKIYSQGTTITTASDVTLTAQWNAASIKLAEAPTKPGYTFENWQIGDKTYKAGETVTLSSNATATAVYTVNKYTVKYDLNGGSMADGSTIEEQAVAYDETFKISSATPMKKDSGNEEEKHTYEFLGWATVAGAITPEYESGQEVKNLTDVNGGVVTLYAVYKDDKTQIIPDPIDPIVIVDTEELKNQIAGLQEKLASLTTTSELTQSDMSQLKTMIQNLFGVTADTASKLVDFIKSCGLSDEVKLRILQHLANGFLTDQDKADLINAIMNSILPEDEKNALIKAINSFTSLTFEQQKKLLESLNSGSSVEWTVDGITYVLTKNADGTISVGIKDLGGVADLVIPNSVTIAGNTYPITTITPGAFKGNTVLRTVTIPSNVSTIGDSAFEGCKNLTTVNTQKGLVTIGKRAFKDCTSLGGFICPETVKTIGDSAFENCTALKTIVLNNGLVTIGKRAFYNCTSLTEVKIPKTVIKIGASAFAKCTKLKKVTFVSFAESQLASLGTGIFAYDKSLTAIKIPSKVRVIPKKTFFKCSKLSKVEGMNKVTSIGPSAFEGCKKLKKITLKSRMQLINEKAFYGCKNLKTVTIKSKGLTKVGSKAFKKCKKGIRFKCPNSKIKSYTKLLKGKY